MDTTTNALNWFEIPADDIDRAKKFYENIFEIEMGSMEMAEMNVKMASFPYEPASGKASGAVVQSPMHKPSQDGAAIYLNANPSMDDVLGRIEAAGGSVAMPKTQIAPEIGYMAFFIDTEGNKVALHSQN